jgi:hypothetical protein
MAKIIQRFSSYPVNAWTKPIADFGMPLRLGLVALFDRNPGIQEQTLDL